jgi:hypothetical protein
MESRLEAGMATDGLSGNPAAIHRCVTRYLKVLID